MVAAAQALRRRLSVSRLQARCRHQAPAPDRQSQAGPAGAQSRRHQDDDEIRARARRRGRRRDGAQTSHEKSHETAFTKNFVRETKMLIVAQHSRLDCAPTIAQPRMARSLIMPIDWATVNW